MDLPNNTVAPMGDAPNNDDKAPEKRPTRFQRVLAEPLPYPDSSLPPVLQETIRRKIEEGDEGVDEATFTEALRRAARSRRPD